MVRLGNSENGKSKGNIVIEQVVRSLGLKGEQRGIYLMKNERGGDTSVPYDVTKGCSSRVRLGEFGTFISDTTRLFRPPTCC